MALEKYSKASGPLAAVTVSIFLITVACSSSPRETLQSTSEIPGITPAPTDVWSAIVQRTPYPYATPLPPASPTILDGAYVKFDPRPDKRAPCRRCPPYPPEGGMWKLHLDRGIFRVYHAGSGWNTLGSFTVSGDQIELFNDPHCYQELGVYTWKLEAGQLALEVVKDDCGSTLRARSLTELPWESCQPSSTEAAITNHWPTPVGCGTTD